MITVKLSRRLLDRAKHLGYSWPKQLQLIAITARDMVSGMKANLAGFAEVVQPAKLTISNSSNDFSYLVTAPDLVLEHPEYNFNLAVKGGGGLLRVVLGVALIGLSLLIPQASAWLLPMGISFIAGGLLEMLTPKPRAREEQSREERRSYLFSSIDSGADDADPIPVAFGTMRLQGIPSLSTKLTQQQT
jgi:predicted phage tail protein